jgi:3-oxoacyl-[acyl-carrier protein] reductase
MFSLDGKTAVVTGASRGIGRAIAEVLASRGARVVIGYVHGQDKAQQVADGIIAAGGSAETIGFDVGDPGVAEREIVSLAKRLGGLDIMVANAGIAIDGLLLRLKDDDLDRTLSVNVKGALACSRGAIKSMMRARKGRIVFLSSVVAEMGNPGQVAYAASKAALLGITKTLAREYAARNITVNAVAPGFIDTDMTHDLPGAAKEKMLQAIPLGRTGTAMEVAAAVAFLCCDEAGYITGQTLRVNGGMYV